MIVSEQDSETSLNRRKPRPHAGAASIWIDWLIGMFQEHWTVLAHLTREFHPLRFSQVVPFACDGSRPVKAASTLGLRLDNRISPICGSSPPSQPRLVCARKAAPPIPPFSSWDRGLLNPARLSFRAHIGCIQCTYSIFKLSPARTDAPFPIHSCRMASVEMCLKLSRIFRREQKRKAAERRLSLSIRFSDMRPSCQ